VIHPLEKVMRELAPHVGIALRLREMGLYSLEKRRLRRNHRCWSFLPSN